MIVTKTKRRPPFTKINGNDYNNTKKVKPPLPTTTNTMCIDAKQNLCEKINKSKTFVNLRCKDTIYGRYPRFPRNPGVMDVRPGNFIDFDRDCKEHDFPLKVEQCCFRIHLESIFENEHYDSHEKFIHFINILKEVIHMLLDQHDEDYRETFTLFYDTLFDLVRDVIDRSSYLLSVHDTDQLLDLFQDPNIIISGTSMLSLFVLIIRRMDTLTNQLYYLLTHKEKIEGLVAGHILVGGTEENYLNMLWFKMMIFDILLPITNEKRILVSLINNLLFGYGYIRDIQSVGRSMKNRFMDTIIPIRFKEDAWNVKAAFLVEDLLPLILPNMRWMDMIKILQHIPPTRATIRYWCQLYKITVDMDGDIYKTDMKQVLRTYLEQLQSRFDPGQRFVLGRQILRNLQQTGVPKQLVDPFTPLFQKQKK